MTDQNLAQATLLIAALRAQLDDMIPKLARTEREGKCGHTSRERALRHEAMLLRRDVGQAQFLIARLQHRFPGADTEPTAPPRQSATETPARDGDHVRPAAAV